LTADQPRWVLKLGRHSRLKVEIMRTKQTRCDLDAFQAAKKSTFGTNLAPRFVLATM